MSTTGSTSTPFGYAGEYTDAETGFLYLRARSYDPASQQFLTVDPLLAATEQAYTYAGGSPTNGTDPSGLCCSSDGGISWGGSGGSGSGGVAPTSGGYLPLDLITKAIIVSSGPYIIYQAVQSVQQCTATLQNLWSQVNSTNGPKPLAPTTVETHGPGGRGNIRNHIVTQIQNMVQEEKSKGNILGPKDICDILSDMYDSASDAKERQAIKLAQKYFNCRPHR